MTDLDQAPHEIAHERADHVRSLPRDRKAAVVAAAVVTLFAGALAVLFGQRSTSAPQPAAIAPTVRSACLASLPQSWRTQAARASTLIVGASSVVPAAATADGGLVVLFQRDDNPATALVYHLGYLAPGADSVRDWGKIPGAGDSASAVSVDVDADFAAVTVDSGSPRLQPDELMMLDIGTGRRAVIARADRPNEPIAGRAYVQGGQIYWQTAGRPGAAQRVYGYDVGSGATRVLASGRALDLNKSAAGIRWSRAGGKVVDRPGPLPARVARQVTAGTFDSFVTDGSSYAWAMANGAVAWWSATTGRSVEVPRLIGHPNAAHGSGAILAVAGPLVFYRDGRTGPPRVLDVRSGASAPVADHATMFGARGRFLGVPALAADPSRTPTNVMRLETEALPVLRC